MKQRLLLLHFYILVLSTGVFCQQDTLHRLDTMVVTESKSATPDKYSEEEDSKQYGFTAYIDNYIMMKNGITKVPEAGSRLIVNGQHHYENRYIIAGVPLYPPSHFSGSAALDFTGLPLHAFSQYAINRHHSKSNGVTIEMEPTIYRTSDHYIPNRSEINMNYNNFDISFYGSTPARNNKDYYQLFLRWPNRHMIKYTLPTNSTRTAYGVPITFFDNIYTGVNDFTNSTLTHTVWFSYDRYSHINTDILKGKKVIPFGLGSINFTNYQIPLSITIGGSHQTIFEGTQDLAYFQTLKYLQHSNAIIAVNLFDLTKGNFTFSTNLTNEYKQWKGKNQVKGGSEDIIYYDIIRYNNDFSMDWSLNTEYRKLGNTFTVNLQTITKPLLKKLLVSPQVSYKFSHNNFALKNSFSYKQSLPDLRGLPTEEYRKKTLESYSFLSDLQYNNKKYNTKLNLGLFYGLNKNAPQQSLIPGYLTWDPSLETPLKSWGVSISTQHPLYKNYLFLTNVLNYTNSKRKVNNGYSDFEYEIPFSLNSILHLKTKSDLWHFFLKSYLSTGQPYRELKMDTTNYQLYYSDNKYRMPFYKRFDFIIEIRNNKIQHRYLSRYDIFLQLGNIEYLFNLNNSSYQKNIRGYNWLYFGVNDIQKDPIFLSSFKIYMGLKAGFRL